ncbi:leucine-rich repeat and immunoglobulin-like domain-containing nogo receptor-interacting protein 3 [Parasteatoda tepidariorum]|uniref:leucine-rich repeat and immunoglobulin-like domain-containing nogo receptor-interacting protein 3 n=1 Tax=Parasteatoda tepidariorum TaxID=114398 RepID=UPI001C720AEC|nr:leucine-rich repeat and immunoglobulin-like domain-containing nogo receptor-interacting protein 3 [Parasteatoda tepidariorum]
MAYKTLLLLWLVCATVAQRCPPEEDLAPSCLCKAYDTFSMLNCNNIMSVEEIIPPIRATESYKIFSVNFEDSSLMYLPNDLFKFTNFEKIRFGNSQVMSLSDTDVAFEGLENTLEEIRATGAHYITTWEWSQLRNLKKLSLIDVNNIGMHSLDNEFPHLESLNALGISNAQISFLHPEAFSGLPNLKLLILKQNQLSEITRNMFPNPAKELHHLDLSDNLLGILPDNIFKNMPVLRELNLSRNKFVTLKEEIFSPAIRILQSLYLKGNAIRCDCRLKWMVNHPTPLYFEGECSEPESLKGDTLRYLKYNELYC